MKDNRNPQSAIRNPQSPRIELSRNDNSLNLRCPFIDLRYLGVAKEALDGVLLHVAVSPKNLDGLGRHRHRGLTREQLAHGAELCDRLAAILGRRGGVEQR